MGFDIIRLGLAAEVVIVDFVVVSVVAKPAKITGSLPLLTSLALP